MAIRAVSHRRLIKASTSAKAAVTANHGVAATSTGTYGSACRSDGIERAITPIRDATASTMDSNPAMMCR